TRRGEVSGRRPGGAEASVLSALELYLGKMGTKALLSREDEIALARRVEEGERAIVEALARSKPALRELLMIGSELRDKKLRAREVLRDADEDELSDEDVTLRLIATLERAAALVEAGGDEKERRAMLEELRSLRLHRRVIDRVVEAVRADEVGDVRDRQEILAAIEAGRRIADRAKAELVEANLRLVILFAKRHKGQGLQLLDLIQEGNIGLMRAADKFDHRRGVRFSTYAAWWVKQQLTRAVADQGKTIRIPVHLVESRRKVTRARKRFAQEHGREPDEAELVAATGLVGERVKVVNELSPEPISLEAPLGFEGEATVGDFVSDMSTPAPDEQIAQTRMCEETRGLLSMLSPREQEVLRMRFGLDGKAERTLQEIGEMMSLSRERVRQIEAEALRKLRGRSVQIDLESYIAA
ncbi:MAG: sigma-70 family RNA polymerase sigma factor, partial [Polyangiaceae bacterium]|nr:sigma-70 family RNA polymerase sigma factor [Polyangiaceae bacterium]